METRQIIISGKVQAVGFRNWVKKTCENLSLGGNVRNTVDMKVEAMITGNKIPFINENDTIKNGLKVLNNKKLGVVIARNNKKMTTGIFTDGDIKRIIQKNNEILKKRIKFFMTKNPISIEKDTLVEKALNIMNERKITSLLVVSDNDYKKPRKVLKGIIHIHALLKNGV